ncbi:CapA family protein [Burkholderia ubonensis]|uniref:CapA family protein n=1 Tax=Burkholderia ubonensis TaxID=101571 RepID=UPI00075740BB|nr:CapA family protein [Burkholderia ubonensis]KVZ47337.1 poly-gamma-glutamate biosynthesis protein [Burkholderia ubonensis]
MSAARDARPAGCARLFLCGDVMTGRGIDQILPHPGDPRLFEPVCGSARDYVRLAEQANGRLPSGRDDAYPWGDALSVLERVRPDARIVNLETAVTASDDRWPGKTVLYRMHPDNVGCLLRARLDCCVLANNHTLDWGRTGLADTLATLVHAGIRPVGAGRDAAEAAAPAVVECAGGVRVRIGAFASPSAGVPDTWAARGPHAGVNLLPDLSPERAEAIGSGLAEARRAAGDVNVVSLHWGGNWGYAASADERAFAHRLIDTGGVDIVYGHSSHHVRGIERYRGRLILYGCGDFLNDYEGIAGYRAYRPDLALMYFPLVDTASGALCDLFMAPMQIRQLSVRRAPGEGVAWLADTLERESAVFGTHVRVDATGMLTLRD